jgi:hypothetical protein
MATASVINVDLADVWATKDRKDLLRTLAWGDEVKVVKQSGQSLEVELAVFKEQGDGSILWVKQTGFIVPSKSSGIKAGDVTKPRRQNEVLKVNFVDVQQGDGAVIESPQGKIMLVDGGDNQLFARYLAARFRATSIEARQPIECILVTHGDADHFVGLQKIFDSEKHTTKQKRSSSNPSASTTMASSSGIKEASCRDPRRHQEGRWQALPGWSGGQPSQGSR